MIVFVFVCVCVCEVFSGESIPVRLFLSPFDISPTFKNVHGKFNVKYVVFFTSPSIGIGQVSPLFLSQFFFNLNFIFLFFSVFYRCRYYLNLVLVDEEERRYFKQQEIQIWRKALKLDESAWRLLCYFYFVLFLLFWSPLPAIS